MNMVEDQVEDPKIIVSFHLMGQLHPITPALANPLVNNLDVHFDLSKTLLRWYKWWWWYYIWQESLFHEASPQPRSESPCWWRVHLQKSRKRWWVFFCGVPLPYQVFCKKVMGFCTLSRILYFFITNFVGALASWSMWLTVLDFTSQTNFKFQPNWILIMLSLQMLSHVNFFWTYLQIIFYSKLL